MHAGDYDDDDDLGGVATDEQAWVDAAVTEVMRRLAEVGQYEDILDQLAPDDRDAVEAAIDRHTARLHAAGVPGW